MNPISSGSQVRRAHLHPANQLDIQLERGYIRYPYDISAFTKKKKVNTSSYNHTAEEDHGQYDHLCCRKGAYPTEWHDTCTVKESKEEKHPHPISSSSAAPCTATPKTQTRLILAHLGGDKVTSGDYKSVPGPFYHCQSPNHAWELLNTPQVRPKWTLGVQFQPGSPIIHLADIDRQGALRDVCSVEDMITAYLESLQSELFEWLNQAAPGRQQDEHRAIINQICRLNGIADLDGTSVVVRKNEETGEDVIEWQFNDYVVVYQTVYDKNHKDSIRIYIPNLIWRDVEDMAPFHMMWQRHIEQAATSVPTAGEDSKVAHAREIALKLYSPTAMSNKHAIDFGIYQAYRLLRLPFQRKPSFKEHESFDCIRAGHRLAVAKGGGDGHDPVSLTYEDHFTCGLVHHAMHLPCVPLEDKIMLPRCAATKKSYNPAAAVTTNNNTNYNLNNIINKNKNQNIKSTKEIPKWKSITEWLRYEVAKAAFERLPINEQEQFTWQMVHSESEASEDEPIMDAGSSVINVLIDDADIKNAQDIVDLLGENDDDEEEDNIRDKRAHNVHYFRSPTVAKFTVLIRLERKQPGYCNVCGRYHDSDNGWLMVCRDGFVVHGCYRGHKYGGRKPTRVPSIEEKFEAATIKSILSCNNIGNRDDDDGDINEYHCEHKEKKQMTAYSQSNEASEDNNIYGDKRDGTPHELGFVRSIEERRFNHGSVIEEFNLNQAQKEYNHPTDGDQRLLAYCNRFFATVHKQNKSSYFEKCMKRAGCTPANHTSKTGAHISWDPSDEYDSVYFAVRDRASFVVAHEKHRLYPRESFKHMQQVTAAAECDHEEEEYEEEIISVPSNHKHRPPIIVSGAYSGKRKHDYEDHGHINNIIDITNDHDEQSAVYDADGEANEESGSSRSMNESDSIASAAQYLAQRQIVQRNTNKQNNNLKLQKKKKKQKQTEQEKKKQKKKKKNVYRPFNVINWWLKQIDSLDYHRIDMLPDLDNVPHGVFTLYNPPRIILNSREAMQDASPLVNHIRDIWCCGNAKLFDYVIKWLAIKVQRPWNKSKVCLVLISNQGAGKNIITEKLHKMMGQHYVVEDDSSNVFGKFNGRLKDALILCLNEAFWSGDQRMRGKLFALVSDAPLTLRIQFQAQFPVTNCIDVIVAANPPQGTNGRVVPVETNDRRFLILELDNKYCNTGDKQHDEAASAYFRYLATVPVAAFKRFLMQVDISSFNPSNKPKTAAHIRQKAMNLKPIDQWVHEVLDNYDEHQNNIGEWTEIAHGLPVDNLQRYQPPSLLFSTIDIGNEFECEIEKNHLYSLFTQHLKDKYGASTSNIRCMTSNFAGFCKEWRMFWKHLFIEKRVRFHNPLTGVNKYYYIVKMPSFDDACEVFGGNQGDRGSDWFSRAADIVIAQEVCHIAIQDEIEKKKKEERKQQKQLAKAAACAAAVMISKLAETK